MILAGDSAETEERRLTLKRGGGRFAEFSEADAAVDSEARRLLAGGAVDNDSLLFASLTPFKKPLIAVSAGDDVVAAASAAAAAAAESAAAAAAATSAAAAAAAAAAV